VCTPYLNIGSPPLDKTIDSRFYVISGNSKTNIKVSQ
jgi:hypothetical protein